MLRRTPLKKRSPILSEEDSLLRRLDDALSEEELRRVLAGALLVLNDAAKKQLLVRLGPETGSALGPVLNPPRSSARSTKLPAPTAGKGKLRQEWDRLWEQWAVVVEQTGDEKGKYVLQDADWEPPYLDTTSIAEDLDAIASRMRRLIPRVIAEQIAPEFSFTEALEALDDDLYTGLPDWIEPGGDESCCLGPEATSCLLAWEWTVAQRARRDAPAFLDDIRDLENRLENVGLDDQTIKKFVLGLSDEHRRAVLSSMTHQQASKRWADAFTRAYGCWAEILRDLSRRWDPSLYAETSRANIPQDWAEAQPLARSGTAGLPDSYGRYAQVEAELVGFTPRPAGADYVPGRRDGATVAADRALSAGHNRDRAPSRPAPQKHLTDAASSRMSSVRRTSLTSTRHAWNGRPRTYEEDMPVARIT